MVGLVGLDCNSRWGYVYLALFSSPYIIQDMLAAFDELQVRANNVLSHFGHGYLTR